MQLCAICLHQAGLDPLSDNLPMPHRRRCGRCHTTTLCYTVRRPPQPARLPQGEQR